MTPRSEILSCILHHPWSDHYYWDLLLNFDHLQFCQMYLAALSRKQTEERRKESRKISTMKTTRKTQLFMDIPMICLLLRRLNYTRVLVSGIFSPFSFNNV